MVRRRLLLALALATVFGVIGTGSACSSDSSGRQPGDTQASDVSTYCTNVADLMGLLDGGASVADYDALLATIVDESPADHAGAWALMLTLSEEPFTYENFNPALDALDAIDLDDTCAGLEPLVVDDDGRVRGR